MSRYRVAVRVLLVLLGVTAAAPAWAQIEITGLWGVRYHEDQEERVPGGELGEYFGIPLTDAARMRADTWDASLYGLREWQCRPHSADYIWRSVHPVRITKDLDPITGEIVALHFNYRDLIDRVIYLDGRPHPSAEAPHTWSGFSTGEWQGEMLTITTTHLKEYILRRDGVPRSDQTTMTEHIVRHGDYLTVMQIVKDPVYLTEPFVLSTDFILDLRTQDAPELCEVEEESDYEKGWVPHRLPGTMHDSEEYAKKHNLPLEAVRGGAETMYPEVQAADEVGRCTMRGHPLRRAGAVLLVGAATAVSLQAQNQAPRPAAPAQPAAATRNAPGEIRTLKIKEDLYLLSGAGSNVVVQLFPQGVTVVDSGSAANAPSLLAAIKQLSARPVVHIINTGLGTDHWGGNATLAASGRRIPVDIVAADSTTASEGPTIVAHEDVLMRLSAKAGAGTVAPERAWPTDTYHSEYKKLSSRYHGGEAIQLIAVPKSNGEGSSLVWLRHADVIVAGDIYSTVGYPPIDVAAGGTIDGVIAGLNEILDLAFFDYRSEGGTLIVPGHGRLSDGADVAYYRDMLTVIRDRVQDAVKKGMSLAQVKAAGLTRDYDPRYGATSGAWTTDMFVEAVYKSLGGK